jgi:imidazolonepropionase-like amidohydrolase
VHIKNPAGFAGIHAAGIVAVRDAGTKDGTGLKAAAPEGLRVVSAGWALFKPGGYGGQFGVPVEGRGDIKAEIHKLAAAGVGIIKVMASGMVSLKEPGRITLGGFDRDEMAFIVDEAGRRGLGVMAHANGEAAIAGAAAAGVRSIEHGFSMTEAALLVLAERKVFWVPTVGALQRAAIAAGVSDDVRAFITRTIEGHLKMIRMAFDQCVPLAIGTDCVLPDPNYRQVYHSELNYFRQAGIPSEAVQRIAREGGRVLLGI